MSARSRIGALAAALVALALVVTGCAGDIPRPRPSATALPTGVSASIVQTKAEIADRQAQLKVHNSSEEVLLISSVRVDDPRFAGVGRRVNSNTSTIAPGATVDIVVQLPLMKCSPDDLADGATPTPTPTTGAVPLATATTTPSGASQSPTPTATITGPPSTTTVTVHYQLGASIAVATEPVAEPVAFLDDLYERECLAEQVAKSASLTLTAFAPSPSTVPSALALSIRPTGDGEARIVAIEATDLLGFAGEATSGAFPIGVDVGVDAGGAPVVVNIPLVPERCDAAALDDDDAVTAFTLEVEVDGEPGEVELPIPVDIRAQILTWMNQWCGFAP